MRLIEKIQVNKVRKPAFRWICANARIARNSRADNLKWCVPLLSPEELAAGGSKRPADEPPSEGGAENDRSAKRLRTGLQTGNEEGVGAPGAFEWVRSLTGSGRGLNPGQMPDRPVAVYPSNQWPIAIAHVAGGKHPGEGFQVPSGGEKNGWREWGVCERTGAGYAVGLGPVAAELGARRAGQALFRQVSAPVAVKLEAERPLTGPLLKACGSLPVLGGFSSGGACLLPLAGGPLARSGTPPLRTTSPEAPVHTLPAEGLRATPEKGSQRSPQESCAVRGSNLAQTYCLTELETGARSPSPSPSPMETSPPTTLRCEKAPARKLRHILPRTPATSAHVAATSSPGLAIPSADAWLTPNAKSLPDTPLFAGLLGRQCENPSGVNALNPAYVQYMAACHALYQQFAAPVHTLSAAAPVLTAAPILTTAPVHTQALMHPAAPVHTVSSYATSPLGAARSAGVNGFPAAVSPNGAPVTNHFGMHSLQGRPILPGVAVPSPKNARVAYPPEHKQGPCRAIPALQARGPTPPGLVQPLGTARPAKTSPSRQPSQGPVAVSRAGQAFPFGASLEHNPGALGTGNLVPLGKKRVAPGQQGPANGPSVGRRLTAGFTALGGTRPGSAKR